MGARSKIRPPCRSPYDSSQFVKIIQPKMNLAGLQIISVNLRVANDRPTRFAYGGNLAGRGLDLVGFENLQGLIGLS